MKKNFLIIIGSGGHTRAVLSTAKLMRKWNSFRILDIDFKNQKEEIMGVEIESYKKIFSFLSQENYNLFISIGDNKKRKKIFLELNNYKNKFTNIIHPTSFIDDSAEIGIGNYLSQFSSLGSYSKLGDFNIINTNANLEHESSLGNFNHLGPGSIVCGRTKIKDNNFIGSNSVIIEQKEISDNNIIGAGSVVLHSIISKGGKYVGAPAKKI